METHVMKSGPMGHWLLFRSFSHLHRSSASLRVTGKIQDYSAETAIAIVAEEGAVLKINTEHLRDISFRVALFTSPLLNSSFSLMMRLSCRHAWVGMLTALT
ncbi:CST complex subunit TEN1 [Tripterygium wilfordii]|uniref:CST complex subunit TEN1 n=1 Tax=Tripterygium wilfordii TaxID=458696 RepID=A0A7J7D0W6_TRIWF|nr:CST complex subunit TEN1 [Tripterygium wilfordii]